MTGIQIKMIAFILMAIDHAGALFLPSGSAAWVFARGMGRLAFPLYAYLASQGIRHTRSIGAYSGRLFLYAFLSEIFFDMAFFGRFPYPACQNTFFTLAFAVAAFCPYQPHRAGDHGKRGNPEKPEDRWMKKAICALCVFCAGVAAQNIHADYGMCGVLLIGAMVFANGDVMVMTIAVLVFLSLSVTWLVPDPVQRAAAAATVTALWFWMVSMDNGEPGERKWRKWFYAAYPAHLAVLWAMRMAAVGI